MCNFNEEEEEEEEAKKEDVSPIKPSHSSSSKDSDARLLMQFCVVMFV